MAIPGLPLEGKELKGKVALGTGGAKNIGTGDLARVRARAAQRLRGEYAASRAKTSEAGQRESRSRRVRRALTFHIANRRRRKEIADARDQAHSDARHSLVLQALSQRLRGAVHGP